MYGAPLAPRVAKAAVYNLAGCDPVRKNEHLACLKKAEPVACSKALLGPPPPGACAPRADRS